MNKSKFSIIGPFAQLLTVVNTSIRGPVKNDDLQILNDAGILISNGHIVKIDAFNKLLNETKSLKPFIFKIEDKVVGMPGFIDSHTHICFAGSRHVDYSARNQGISYLEIARQGGGIWDTVSKTRNCSDEELLELTTSRVKKCILNGITTVEIKSGYGLNIEQELKQLRTIKKAKDKNDIDVVSTCLAAHIKPKDFQGDNKAYLDLLISGLLPIVKNEMLSNRVDIFVEEDAFIVKESEKYLNQAKNLGFQITIHGDQFSVGGSELAVKLGAISVDHLEVSGEREIKILGQSDTVATVLPGASIGIGCNFAPARKLLDAGAILAIASDWNPGSGPMGDLLTQAAILGAYEKLSDAEIFSGITFRAAKALGLEDRGRLRPGYLADIVAYPIQDFREILYHQGQIKPKYVWKQGEII